MFYYNVLLRRIQNRWMDGIVMKVLFDEFNGFHIYFFFNFLKWLVLFCFGSLPYFSIANWIFLWSLTSSTSQYDTFTDTKLYQGEKHLVAESMINSYTWQMNLTIKNLHKNDFMPHICSSINALGKSDARIRLQGKFFLKFVLFVCWCHFM